MMKRISPISIVSIVLAFFALGLLSADSALCQAKSYSLLLQQMPSQGGIISPEIGVHYYSSESQVTLIAVPQPGYQFVYWLGDVLDPTANKTTALLNESKVIVAVFQQVEEGQLIVGQNVPTGGGGGGSFSSGSSISPAVNRTRGGGGSPNSGGSTPTPPGEGDPGLDPPDDPPDNPPVPIDPPVDPPGVPEPATGLMLILGAAALLRKRRAAKTS
jgi:hypothetical protein